MTFTPQKQRSVGLCIMNSDHNIFIVQSTQDELLWQMPELPIEYETNPVNAVDHAMLSFFPNTSYKLLETYDQWLEQKIPDFVAKKEGLISGTITETLWFLISVDRLNKDHSASHTQWIAYHQLLTLVPPYKRVSSKTVLDLFGDYFSDPVSHKGKLKIDFKRDSHSVSKKTRQKTYI